MHLIDGIDLFKISKFSFGWNGDIVTDLYNSVE